ncbi:unnamed protein product [Acanthoscelides obtectus]|uniref:40S ribosomal protein S19 n=1 Tax=Acanthoscelides obtectus TaxID=200917 RepID=A0A9P0PYG9_ACAOB|nr:unnamed protein product [Acanthoscelides obtectus]CAK1629443.1 40S ribosomal protein S19 [Acanthoscelides obtectus]
MTFIIYNIKSDIFCSHLSVCKGPTGKVSFPLNGSAGSIARKALQSLEGLKLIEKCPDGGRKLTQQGRRDLDRIAAQVKAKERKALKASTVLTL